MADKKSDKLTIDCCGGLLGRECLKERCKLPVYQAKFKRECQNIDSYIQLAKECKVDLQLCQNLPKAWLWIVILVVILIVIVAIAILIYVVYQRKFHKPDKKKHVEYKLAYEPNLESHVVVETKGGKKHKKHKDKAEPKAAAAGGGGSSQGSMKKKQDSAPNQTTKQNSFVSRTPKDAMPTNTADDANSNLKISRSSIRRAVA